MEKRKTVSRSMAASVNFTIAESMTNNRGVNYHVEKARDDAANPAGFAKRTMMIE